MLYHVQSPYFRQFLTTNGFKAKKKPANVTGGEESTAAGASKAEAAASAK